MGVRALTVLRGDSRQSRVGTPLNRQERGDSLLQECGISFLIASVVSVKLEAKQSGKCEN